MKVCQIPQAELVYLGIGPYDANKKTQYNKFIFVYSLLVTLSFGLSTAYLFIEANTFEEITQCIYIISASILSPIAVGSLALQQKILFKQFDRIETIIHSSKNKKKILEKFSAHCTLEQMKHVPN